MKTERKIRGGLIERRNEGRLVRSVMEGMGVNIRRKEDGGTYQCSQGSLSWRRVPVVVID